MKDFFEQHGILDIVKTGKVMDLGCGDGRDSFAFARAGFVVDAIDTDKQKVSLLRKKIGSEGLSNMTVTCADVASSVFPDDTYSIIIIKNVLPFIAKKESVKNIVERSVKSLLPGGFLYVTLFGPHDDWANRERMSFFEMSEATDMFLGLGLKKYFVSTEEGYGKTILGELKYWHIHKFIYQK